MPPLDFIPSKLVDAAVSGGGNPQARPPVAVPTPPVPTPPIATPPPPAPAQRSPESVKEPEPPKDPPREVVKTQAAPDSFETSKTRKLPNVSTRLVNAKPDKPKPTRQTDSQQQDQADAQRRSLARAISSTARSLRDDLSPSTTIDTNYGPGGGGEAYANYDQVVKSVYQHAWVLPDTDVEEAIVKVRVTISRDGRVTSSEVVRRSGNSIVDTSIQRTLDRVTFVAPFPEGSKDKERTFPISFSLKAKRLLG